MSKHTETPQRYKMSVMNILLIYLHARYVVFFCDRDG